MLKIVYNFFGYFFFFRMPSIKNFDLPLCSLSQYLSILTGINGMPRSEEQKRQQNELLEQASKHFF